VTQPTSNPADDRTRGRWAQGSGRRRTGWTGPLAFGTALLAAGLALSGFTTSAGSRPAPPKASIPSLHKGTVHTARVTGLGLVVVDRAGRTLYLFNPDKQKNVTCTGECARAWPPLDVTSRPVAGTGIKAALLGTVKSPNGKPQVTYNHWPLYTFSGDSKAGQAHGQGLTAFGGRWFAVTPAGQRARKSSHPATVHVAKASGVGKVLVNSGGRTLYLFNPDKQKMVTCTGACAAVWPPLDVTAKPAAGTGIKAALLGTVRAPNGKTQVTYNHWPLYTFADDSKAGEANGQGLTAFGGTWFAITSAGLRAVTPGPTTSTTNPPSGY